MSDYQGAASSAAAKSLQSGVGGRPAGLDRQPSQRTEPVRGAKQPNELEEADEDDDEQDSEALLYKMMQQQSFLMSPHWQEPDAGKAAGSGRPARPASSQAGEGANSKRLIKLLKSYSHIHQVDDSDDQIRGTHTRLMNRRPQAQMAGWRPSQFPAASQHQNQHQHQSQQQQQNQDR